MNPLRTAILGCGGFARHHAQLLTTLSAQAQLVACCDRNLDRAQQLAADFTDGRAAVFTDHHQLIDNAQLDLLIICLPPYGHRDEVAYAAVHGIHIFIEKPIALTSTQAWQMVNAAE